MLIAQGAFVKARAMLSTVLSAQQARLPPASEELMQTKIKMIELLLSLHETVEAADMLKGFTMALEKNVPPQSMIMAEIKHLQACMLLTKADYKDADDLLRDAARIVSSCVGKPLGQEGKIIMHPLSLRISKLIAEKSLIQGRYDEARNILESSSKSASATDLLHTTSLTIAELKEAFALLSDKVGKPRQAMQYLYDAYDMRKNVPRVHPDALLRVLLLVAQQEINMGSFREAQTTTDSAATTFDKSHHQSKLDRAEIAILQVLALVMFTHCFSKGSVSSHVLPQPLALGASAVLDLNSPPFVRCS
jgi:hypothetical protein